MASFYRDAPRHASAAFFAAFVLALFIIFPARASESRAPIVPQAKLRITVVQWVPSKGEYQRWDTVSGEFVVSSSGVITLPLIGTLNVSNSDTAEVANQISERFKTKAGLIEPPNATVDIAEYPPVYVLGSVATPGAKPFRPGLTVLQALSLSGGVFRPSTETGLKGQVGLLGDLEDTRNEIVRATVRLSRLQAEMEGREEIDFPAQLIADSNDRAIVEVVAQEKIIFKARRNALERQLQNLSELRNLLRGEIDILGQKTQGLEANIKSVENELGDVKSLVDRGIATVSRRSELERAVAGLRADRLDQITAAMRARQNLSEATRNEVGLRDQYQTEVSTQLQQVQASLERLKIKEDVLKKTLVLTAATTDEGAQAEAKIEPELSFTIVRNTQGKSEEISALETTILMPDDVLKVAVVERSKRWPGRPVASAVSSQ